MPLVRIDLPKDKAPRERRTTADVIYAVMRKRRFSMAAKLSEGDTIDMQGEGTGVREDGNVTVWLHGYWRASRSGREEEAGAEEPQAHVRRAWRPYWRLGGWWGLDKSALAAPIKPLSQETRLK